MLMMVVAVEVCNRLRFNLSSDLAMFQIVATKVIKIRQKRLNA